MNDNRIKNVVLISLFSLFLISLYCRNNLQSPVIARVGKAVLTLEDINRNIPPEYGSQITKEQNINYVKQWIDTELLYQEALRKKIDRDNDVRMRLAKMKKDLLAAETINRKLSGHAQQTINEGKIHEYYEANKDKFIREKDIVKYMEIVVSDYRTALYITKNGTTENFATLAAEFSQQPIPDNLNSPFLTLDEIQPEIARAISGTVVGSTSIPVKTDQGYHVVLVIDKLEQGGICKEEEIKDDIINQLAAKIQKEKMELFLSDLRLKTNVVFNPNLIKNEYQKQKAPPLPK